MSRALKQICLAGTVVAFVFASIAAAQSPTMREDVRKDLDTAVKLFKQAEFEKAAAALDKVIEKSPSSEEALILRERAGIAVLAKMLRDPRLGPNAQRILHKAAEEGARVQRDPATIKKLVENMGSPDKVVRWQSIRHLTAVGPFAVPYLLDHALSAETNSSASRKVAALIILRDMKSAGTPPLIVAARNAVPLLCSHRWRTTHASRTICAAQPGAPSYRWRVRLRKGRKPKTRRSRSPQLLIFAWRWRFATTMRIPESLRSLRHTSESSGSGTLTERLGRSVSRSRKCLNTPTPI